MPIGTRFRVKFVAILIVSIFTFLLLLGGLAYLCPDPVLRIAVRYWFSSDLPAGWALDWSDVNWTAPWRLEVREVRLQNGKTALATFGRVSLQLGPFTLLSSSHSILESVALQEIRLDLAGLAKAAGKAYRSPLHAVSNAAYAFLTGDLGELQVAGELHAGNLAGPLVAQLDEHILSASWQARPTGQGDLLWFAGRLSLPEYARPVQVEVMFDGAKTQDDLGPNVVTVSTEDGDLLPLVQLLRQNGWIPDWLPQVRTGIVRKAEFTVPSIVSASRSAEWPEVRWELALDLEGLSLTVPGTPSGRLYGRIAGTQKGLALDGVTFEPSSGGYVTISGEMSSIDRGSLELTGEGLDIGHLIPADGLPLTGRASVRGQWRADGEPSPLRLQLTATRGQVWQILYDTLHADLTVQQGGIADWAPPASDPPNHGPPENKGAASGHGRTSPAIFGGVKFNSIEATYGQASYEATGVLAFSEGEAFLELSVAGTQVPSTTVGSWVGLPPAELQSFSKLVVSGRAQIQGRLDALEVDLELESGPGDVNGAQIEGIRMLGGYADGVFRCDDLTARLADGLLLGRGTMDSGRLDVDVEAVGMDFHQAINLLGLGGRTPAGPLAGLLQQTLLHELASAKVQVDFSGEMSGSSLQPRLDGLLTVRPPGVGARPTRAVISCVDGHLALRLISGTTQGR